MDIKRLEFIKAHILNPLLSIKVPLKVAYKPSDWLQAAFRSTFIDKRGFRIWAKMYMYVRLTNQNKEIFVPLDLIGQLNVILLHR